jgi:SsrA-binding protein
MVIQNRKAHFHYFIEEEHEAGIVLLGSEVKSLRQGRANISESYIAEKNGEFFLTNAHISEYKGANKFNHEPTRQRKLLLHKKEMRKLIGKLQKKNYSIVPTKIYFNKKGFAKISIGLGKGKKLYDKRETIKNRDETRRIQREGE